MGQKRPFSVPDARRLKRLLNERSATRDLALVSVAFDSCLRSCDLLSLEWSQLLNEIGEIRERVTIRQRKTGANVSFELGRDSRRALKSLFLAHTARFVFEGGTTERALGGRQYRRLVKRWARMLGLEEGQFGTHSLRRTRPAAVYKATKDPEIARILLGQKTLQATHRYLGVNQEEAFVASRQIRI